MITFPIYFDNNSTTPLDPAVLERMLPYFRDVYGNPASISHVLGLAAERVVEKYRISLADCFNCRPEGVIFTSGATESINLLIKGLAESCYPAKDHIISTPIEHSATKRTLDYLAAKGLRISYLSVDRDGFIDPLEIESTINSRTMLVTIIAANNEIGTIQPWEQCADICARHSVPIHLDFAQAGGKIKLDMTTQKISCATISAHKNFGPKGSGALILNDSSVNGIVPLIHGGSQEAGLRAGTLNVPAITGLCECMLISHNNIKENHEKVKQMWDRFYNGVVSGDERVTLNGPVNNRLYTNLNIFIKNVRSERIYKTLNDVAFSSSSACTSGSADGSMILRAIGKNDFQAKNSVRFGIGIKNTIEEIDYVTKKLKSLIERT